MAETVTPRRRAASRSMAALAGPVVTRSPQAGGASEYVVPEPGAFAHRDEHVEAGEGRDDLLGPGEGLGEDGDLAGQTGPVGELCGDTLVVVQDRDAEIVGHPDSSYEEAASGKPAGCGRC